MKKCPICNFEAKSEGGLKTHLRSHDKGVSSVTEKWLDVKQAVGEEGLTGKEESDLLEVENTLNSKGVIELDKD